MRPIREAARLLLVAGVGVTIAVGGLGVVLAGWTSGDLRDDPDPECAADPRLEGHADVLVVDPNDRIVRGQVVVDYDGHLARDPRWEERRVAVEAAVPAAAAFVAHRLGFRDRQMPPFVVRFRDDVQMGQPIFMSTYQELRGTEFRPLIVVGVDALLARRYDLEKVLRHEIAHCLHLASLGEPFYSLPPWVKEGLAEWASGKGTDALRQYYLRHYADPGEILLDSHPEGEVWWSALLDGLEGPHGGEDYGEDYLAFAMVEELLGMEAVHRLVGELFRHPFHRVALQRVTGWPWEEFDRRFREWALRYLNGDLADRPKYLRAKVAFLAKDYAAAIRAYDEYLHEPRSASFRALAFVEVAEARLEIGGLDAAAADLQSAASTEPMGPLTRRIKLGSLRIAARRGAWTEVERGCRDYLEDFGGGPSSETAEVEELLLRARAHRGADGATAVSPHSAPGDGMATGISGRPAAK